ncbi:trypsin-like serine protease [Streptomyces eurocidicus]|uniref:Putative serine protease PepD n=1 Tax=Streptomyces eurocidicus TaxID=66423 RepID=A0A7W8B947_STREU|nr:trypsin-like peptidase domain-containing protein [Streptomyces eurocidicus]MBB5117926.1 putative serine protease PepD [Streptomyces eurocidicus]MBF6053907.1 trypsin-like serine protease [Streptomyces eurocidicus]
MTDNHRRDGAQDPQQHPQQPYAYPAPPAYAPQRPVTTASGVTVWPGDGSGGHGGGGGTPTGYADFAAPGPGSDGAPAAHAAPRARRPVALLAACAILAAVVGGGSAALVGQLTDGSGGSSHSTPVQNASSKSSGVSAVAKAVMPSIVEIKAATASGQSTGSGVVITADGEIVTNNHVVAGADTVKVSFSDGSTKDAKVVGTDPDKDLALIKVQGASGLTPAALGDSGKVQVGDQVVAIGSPEGLTGTVTSGIVSALNRDVTVSKEQGQDGRQRQRQGGGLPQWPFEFGGNQYNGDTGSSKTTYKAIQTDASLNPGNSGGALINMNGEIIGINSAMYASAGSGDSAGSVGLGFSIPINTVKADLAKLRAGGTGG